MADRDGDCSAEDSATKLFETVGFLVAQLLPSKGLLPRIGASHQNCRFPLIKIEARKASVVDSAPINISTS
jgi:hypothetical protein